MRKDESPMQGKTRMLTVEEIDISKAVLSGNTTMRPSIRCLLGVQCVQNVIYREASQLGGRDQQPLLCLEMGM